MNFEDPLSEVAEKGSDEEGPRNEVFYAEIVRGYDSQEESCLVMFSEFLGFSTIGHEKEILDLMRKLNDNRVQLRSKGQMVSSRCERELKKPECTINYNG